MISIIFLSILARQLLLFASFVIQPRFAHTAMRQTGFGSGNT